MKLTNTKHAAAIAALLLTASATHAQNFTATNQTIDFDRWNYPFNATNGNRNLAPIFGALEGPDFTGPAGFDERDGQMLLGINTAALGITTGLDPSQYQINALSIDLTQAFGSFLYDPTYDGFQTYLDPSDPNFVADADAGRPIILTGAGLRGPFTDFSFGAANPGAPDYEEFEAFGDNGPTPLGNDAQDRNAFAAAFDSGGNLVDISNNVGTNGIDTGFDFTPFAVGTTDVTPGDPVVEGIFFNRPGSTFTFDITTSLTDPNILAYIQQGLSDGALFFSVTSLHGAGQQTGGTNPNFYTSENLDPAAITPNFSLDITIAEANAIPLPGAGAMGALGLAMVASRRKYKPSKS